MGSEVSKAANTTCSNFDCTELCVDADGHRVRLPTKSRMCSICFKWYCGAHKNVDMKRRFKGAEGGLFGAQQGGGGEHVYKCNGCIGDRRNRQHVMYDVGS